MCLPIDNQNNECDHGKIEKYYLHFGFDLWMND